MSSGSGPGQHWEDIRSFEAEAQLQGCGWPDARGGLC